MIYTYSLLGFIFYYIIVNFIEWIDKKLNSHKPIYQYMIIEEDENDDNLFDITFLFLLFLPVFVQSIFMLCYIIYIINKLYHLYLAEKKVNKSVYIKTSKIIFGIFVTLNTIINSFEIPIFSYTLIDKHVIYSFINLISLYLLANSYVSKISTSFTSD
jgi:hypothetical protein